MNYVSTRGGKGPDDVAPKGASPEVVALQGLAPDGGLYVPDVWPSYTASDLADIAAGGYADTVAKILSPFTGHSIVPDDLSALCHRAYGSFTEAEVTPLRQIAPGKYILELFHGPTFSFKDVALQFLGLYLGHLLGKSDQKLTIIGATSGDTGSAAIEAVKGVPGIDIVMLHPKGRTSEVQRRQMTTVLDPGVHNIAIDAGFDQCQRIVKTLLSDTSLRQGSRGERHISAVNSINWFRIAAQSVYYMRTAAKLDRGQGVTFAVPSGNFGNAFAAWVASRQGAPIANILAVTNANDIIAKVLNSGEYRPGQMVETISPAMDIQTASNFERLLFDLCDRKGARVSQLAGALETEGGYRLDPALLAEAQQLFSAATTDEAGTIAEMRRISDETGLTVDPHTAVALAAARNIDASEDRPVVIAATAHPAKFADAVVEATGQAPQMPDALVKLGELEERCTVLPDSADAVRDYILEHGLI